MHRLPADQIARLRALYTVPAPRLAAEEPAAPAPDDPPKQQYTGTMVAFMLPPELAQQLAVDGGEPVEDLHVTLAYLPESPQGDELDRLHDVVGSFANGCGPLTGEISGLGLFTAGPEPVTYASVDVPALPQFRQRLVQALSDAQFDVSKSHGYTPHVTLAYGDRRHVTVPNLPLTFGALTVAAGDDRTHFPLANEPEQAAIKPKPHPGHDAETEVVKVNKKMPAAQHPHPFTPSKHHPSGSNPRCLTCGNTNQPSSGMCPGLAADPNGSFTQTDKPKGDPIPVQASVDDDVDAGKIAAGIDAGVDQALVLLRSTPDLADYPAQARDLLQGIEPACDALLTYFGVTDPDDSSSERAYVRERVAPIRLAKPLPSAAFITEIKGKTVVTAQAVVETAKTPHEHFLWTGGRLVGADQANRNGAYWSSGDLELGKVTVPYGPLNWLHEERHVIGTIAAAELLPGDSGFEQTHIAIAAPVWSWIYPDEAAVIEMASDAGKFWYSMECISRSVQCIGDGGCGSEVSYADYMLGRNGACEHMITKSSTRRLVDPTFLGAAVIVPPVRPGWAEADASVFRQAASLAEKAFDQAGRPDMTTSEWETLMAQVVGFATA